MAVKPVVIRVKWRSRTAGFDGTAVDVSTLLPTPTGPGVPPRCIYYVQHGNSRSDEQDIVHKACVHFRLRSYDHDYILLGDVHGTEIELTDDMLKYLPNLATVKLSRVPNVCDSDEDTPSLDLEMSNQSAHAPPLHVSRPAG